METIIKSFVGMFFALLLLLLGAGLIAASVNARNAGAFAAELRTAISRVRSLRSAVGTRRTGGMN